MRLVVGTFLIVIGATSALTSAGLASGGVSPHPAGTPTAVVSATAVGVSGGGAPGFVLTPDTPATPTSSATPKSFAGPIVESFASSLGTILAAGLLVLVAVVFLAICRFLRPPRPELRLEAFRLVGGKPVVEAGLATRVQFALRQLREDVALLERWIAFYDEQLRRFGFYDLMPGAVSDPGGVHMTISLGPVEISTPRRWLDSLLGRRPFVLSVSEQPVAAFPAANELVFSLYSGGTLWYAWRRTTSLGGDENAILDVARQVAWAISRKSARDVEVLAFETPPEVHILRGLHILAEYKRSPESVGPLEVALDHFDAAGSATAEWEFHAGLLRAIVMQLSQARPAETARVMEDLMTLWSADEARKQLVRYNLGQAKFYTYNAHGYQEALKHYQAVERPHLLLWASWERLWRVIVSRRRAARYQYGLYCLAQCNIAITLAHMIGRNREADENADLARRARRIVEEVGAELGKNRRILRPLIGEIQWRAYNAEAMVGLNLRDDVESALRAAEKAQRLWPHALDVKANVGSLKLLIARRHAAAGLDPTATREFEEAREVFEDLARVGWDPGFVFYRLGEIRRVQGEQDKARELLRRAGDPEIRDVHQGLIDRQLQLADSGDTTLYMD